LDSAQADVNKAREFDQRSQKVHQKQQNLERLRKLAERKDYYKILGVPKTASDKDIKSAYRKLAMQYHPDKTQSLPEEEREKAQALFRDIAEAKDILSDDEKRGKYDRGEDLNEQQHHGHHPHHHFHHPGGQHFEFRFG
jgi:DnaJ family protein C protein 3